MENQLKAIIISEGKRFREVDVIIEYLAKNSYSRLTLMSDGGSILRNEHGGLTKTFESLDELYEYINTRE